MEPDSGPRATDGEALAGFPGDGCAIRRPGAVIPPWRRVALLVLFYALLAAGGCGWIAARSGVEGIERLAGDGAAGLCVGAGLAVGITAIGAAASRRFAWFRDMEDDLRRAIGPLSLGQVAALATASGAAEEIVFRGALQAAWGWVTAGLVFGALHVPLRRTLVPWTLSAVAIGLGFGYCAERMGGIIGVTVAHVGVNAVNLWRLCGAARR